VPLRTVIAPHESHAGASSWLFRMAAFRPAMAAAPVAWPLPFRPAPGLASVPLAA
jgi:hypothetical protein